MHRSCDVCLRVALMDFSVPFVVLNWGKRLFKGGAYLSKYGMYQILFSYSSWVTSGYFTAAWNSSLCMKEFIVFVYLLLIIIIIYSIRDSQKKYGEGRGVRKLSWTLSLKKNTDFRPVLFPKIIYTYKTSMVP